MHAYNVLANRTEVYAGGEGIITLSEPNRMNSAVGEDESRGYEFHDSQTCRDAIEGRFTSANTTASRFLLLHETVVTMQRRHNDLIHEANQVLHRVQQSWHSLAEAYDAWQSLTMEHSPVAKRTGQFMQDQPKSRSLYLVSDC